MSVQGDTILDRGAKALEIVGCVVGFIVTLWRGVLVVLYDFSNNGATEGFGRAATVEEKVSPRRHDSGLVVIDIVNR